MRLVRVRILVRERIGQVGIEQQVAALPLKEETALPEPPQMQTIRRLHPGLFDILDEVVVLKKGFDHVPDLA